MPLYAESLHAFIMGMQQQNKPGYTKPGFHPQCQAHELLHMHTSKDWETEEQRGREKIARHAARGWEYHDGAPFGHVPREGKHSGEPPRGKEGELMVKRIEPQNGDPAGRATNARGPKKQGQGQGRSQGLLALTCT